MSVFEPVSTVETEWVEKVYAWQYQNTGSFFNGLCSLWMKADNANKTRLRKGFPELCDALAAWYMALNQEEFFKQYGLGPMTPFEKGIREIEEES